MLRHFGSVGVVGLVLAAAVVGLGLTARAQQAPRGPHGEHRTPEGWKFAWPKGDPAKGRAVFVKLECYSCHEVKGETFPAPTDKEKVGPELSAMAPLHEPEYFAEAIINPSAVIEKGKGYAAPDGSSKMPSFNHLLTVEETADLVAYLKALGRAGGGHATH